MEYRYIIYDYYDWPETEDGKTFIANISDYQMGQLERYGWAKSYFLTGELREAGYNFIE